MTADQPGGRVLVTNDDGIDAPGLHALATAAVAAGLDVVVAAPAEDASGAGSSLMAHRTDGVVAIQPATLNGLPGVPAFGVAGHPAFIVFAAMTGWLDPAPTLVLSGVNYGANLGRAVLHSGTVGAAITAGRFGARGLAVSLDCDHLPPGAAERWDTAGTLLPMALEVLAESPAGTVLSLNVPNLPVGRLGEPRVADLADAGRWKPEVTEVEGGLRVRGVRRPGALPPGSDAALLSAGHPTLTAIAPVGEDTGVDLDGLLSRLARHPA